MEEVLHAVIDGMPWEDKIGEPKQIESRFHNFMTVDPNILRQKDLFFL